MPASTAVSAFGTVLKYGSTSSPSTVAGEILDISGPSFSADIHEVTHQESPAFHKEYICGLVDIGEVTFSLNLIASASSILSLLTNRTLQYWSVECPIGTANAKFKFVFQGYVTKFEPSFPVSGDRPTCSLTIKGTGSCTVTTT